MAYFWTSPLDVLAVTGTVDFIHTAGAAEEHALEIDVNAAGFGDVKAIDIVYVTGAVAAGSDDEVILVNIDETASSGGDVSGYEVVATSEGSATIHGYTTGINIHPILHNSGAFGDADDILNKAVDVTAALASGGAGSITAFVLNSETMTFGDAAAFNEMEFILGTFAGGAGISPTFEYSTGGVGFSSFTPADGTNGLRNNGAILWITADLAGWVANATGFFEVKMTRNRVTLPTIPILDEVQIVAATEYTWDSTGNVTINSLTLTTDLTVANGGTGASTLTGVLTGNGASAFTASAVTDNTVIMGSTSNLVQDTTITVTDNGEMVNTSQPAFLGYLDASALNKTGTGTAYTIGADTLTEVFDQNADFTTAGVFTSPVTGRYDLKSSVIITGVTVATSMDMSLTTSNRTYFGQQSRAAAATNIRVEVSALADMDASDTATVLVASSGEAGDTDDILGAATLDTYFCGALIC